MMSGVPVADGRMTALTGHASVGATMAWSAS
jgi:hypothetical protein